MEGFIRQFVQRYALMLNKGISVTDLRIEYPMMDIRNQFSTNSTPIRGNNQEIMLIVLLLISIE